MWFKKLTGFDEVSPEYVRNNITIVGKNLTSKINNRSFQFGELEIISLAQLRTQFLEKKFSCQLKLSEIVANVQDLHCDPSNKNAFFQAASEFNLLEMINPDVSPEKGIDMYERDFTQGPACAITCGAGTIFRNYFAPINGSIGQTSTNQINCLEDIGKELNNEEFLLWRMSNGYAFVNQKGILNINKQLSHLNRDKREFLKGKLKIGIQWNTEVTIANKNQIVSQVYCSALPVAYSQIEFFYWESFARVILEATYEATLYSAMLNLDKNKSTKVFLTLVGGGAFGNEIEWILESLIKVIKKFKNFPLDVKVVSYDISNALLQKVIAEYNS